MSPDVQSRGASNMCKSYWDGIIFNCHGTATYTGFPYLGTYVQEVSGMRLDQLYWFHPD